MALYAIENNTDSIVLSKWNLGVDLCDDVRLDCNGSMLLMHELERGLVDASVMLVAVEDERARDARDMEPVKKQRVEKRRLLLRNITGGGKVV